MVTKQLLEIIDFHSKENKKNKYKWQQASIWLPTFFNIFFRVQQKKEMHTGLEQHEGGKISFWEELFL